MKLLKPSLAIVTMAVAASSASALSLNSTTFMAHYEPDEAIAKLNSSSSGEASRYSWGNYFEAYFGNIQNSDGVSLLDALASGEWMIDTASAVFGFADYVSQHDRYGIDKHDLSGEYQGYEYDGRENVTATVDGNDVGLNNVEVDGVHGQYDNQEGTISSDDFGDLEDGTAEFKVEATKGNTYLKTAKITVELKKTPTVSVPDSGTTAILFGSSLLGLVAARRKFRK